VRLDFHEMQQFRQWWLWLLLGATTLLVIGVFTWGMITQLVLGNYWGDQSMPDLALGVVGTAAIALALVVLYGFYAMKLVTDVRENSLHVRLFPFIDRRIPYGEITGCEVRSYRAIAEYGGWGVRFVPGKGWAYNISGSGGVELELAQGRKVLVGSRRPEELAEAIRARMATP